MKAERVQGNRPGLCGGECWFWAWGPIPILPLTHAWAPETRGYVALVVKTPHASAGDVRDAGLIPGSRRSLGGGHGNPLQYPCLKNPMDRGDWRVIVHRVAKSQTRLKQLSIYAKELFTDITARLQDHSGDFLVVKWLKICLAMQGMCVRSLVGELCTDAATPEPMWPNWSPKATTEDPTCCN